MAENLFEFWAKFRYFRGYERIKTYKFQNCFVFINKEKISFKSRKGVTYQEILLGDIQNFIKEKRYIKIFTTDERVYAFCAVKPNGKSPYPYNTDRAYSLLKKLEGIKGVVEQTIIEKIKNLIKVSTRINVNVLKEVLGVDDSIYYQNIFNVAAKLGLTIDGDYLKVDKISDSDFIRALNDYLNLGINDEMLVDEKLSCPYCGAPLKPNAKFCTQCGTTLVKDPEEKE